MASIYRSLMDESCVEYVDFILILSYTCFCNNLWGFDFKGDLDVPIILFPVKKPFEGDNDDFVGFVNFHELILNCIFFAIIAIKAVGVLHNVWILEVL